MSRAKMEGGILRGGRRRLTISRRFLPARVSRLVCRARGVNTRISAICSGVELRFIGICTRAWNPIRFDAISVKGERWREIITCV